jgi:hypothetical protein
LWLWLLRRKKNCVGDWSASGLVAQELYDHTADKGFGPQTFDDFEFTNLAYDAAHQVRKNCLFCAVLCYLKPRVFAKKGSGQTHGTQKDVSPAGHCEGAGGGAAKAVWA